MPSFSPALHSQSTVVFSDTFKFLAIDDDNQLDDEEQSTLQVWTNLTGTWQEHAFVKHETEVGSILVADVPITSSGSFEFTYRRQNTFGHITWLSEAAGSDNGVIKVASTARGSDLSLNPLQSLPSSAIVEEGAPAGAQSDINVRTIKFSLVDDHEGSVESFQVITLGGFASGLSIERAKPTWFQTRTLSSNVELSPDFDCQLLLYQSGPNVVAVFPLSLSDASSTLRGSTDPDNGHNPVWLRSEREKTGPAQGQCVIAWGPSAQLLEIIHACIKKAKEAIESDTLQDEAPTKVTEIGKPSWSLQTARKAVFCTWNSLGQDYNLSGTMSRLEDLKTQGHLDKFESLLLDDGWQDVAFSPENKNLRCLRSFGLREGWYDENAQAGSDGTKTLADAVQLIKTKYPGIRTIGVWMTIQGYWNGLHPDSDISHKYKLVRYGIRKSRSQYPHPAPFEYIYLPSLEDSERYWTDYFTTLRDAGIHFVKIDNQASLDYIVGEGSAALRAHHSRTARAVAYKIFGPGNLINCMAGSPRYYNELLSHRSNSAASLRTSDDFFPNEPDSHRFHIAFNAGTGFLDRELSATRDFDMFTTHHELAEYHATLRCFSNAPIYVTDGEPSNVQIFNQLGGPDRQGVYRIVKATSNKSVRLPSTAFTDITADKTGPALKYVLPVHAAKAVAIGVWNCRGGNADAIDALTIGELEEAARLGKIDDKADVKHLYQLAVLQGKPEEWSILASHTLTASADIAARAKVAVPLHLVPGKCKRLSYAAVQKFSDFEMSVFGLADEFVGLAAVLRVEELSVGHRAKGTSRNSARSSTENIQHTAEDSTPEQVPAPQTVQTTSLQRRNIRGSRLLALLFFYRRDARRACSSFLHDFWRAPLSTLYSELSAMLGGPSTLPPPTPQMPTHEPTPEMQQALSAAPASYGTFNAAETPSLGSRITQDQSKKCRKEVEIELSVAGLLAVHISDFDKAQYEFHLEGNKIPEEFIHKSKDIVRIDMEGAASEMDLKMSVTTSSNWHVSVRRRSEATGEEQ